jgi:hypothetical protein
MLYGYKSYHCEEEPEMLNKFTHKFCKVFISVLIIQGLYSSPNIVRVIKWRRMRWAGHVARMGEERGCISSWWGYRREKDHWGDIGVDG